MLHQFRNIEGGLHKQNDLKVECFTVLVDLKPEELQQIRVRLDVGYEALVRGHQDHTLQPGFFRGGLVAYSSSEVFFVVLHSQELLAPVFSLEQECDHAVGSPESLGFTLLQSFKSTFNHVG